MPMPADTALRREGGTRSPTRLYSSGSEPPMLIPVSMRVANSAP